jgi:hypothetical protein
MDLDQLNSDEQYATLWLAAKLLRLEWPPPAHLKERFALLWLDWRDSADKEQCSRLNLDSELWMISQTRDPNLASDNSQDGAQPRRRGLPCGARAEALFGAARPLSLGIRSSALCERTSARAAR